MTKSRAKATLGMEQVGQGEYVCDSMELGLLKVLIREVGISYTHGTIQ